MKNPKVTELLKIAEELTNIKMRKNSINLDNKMEERKKEYENNKKQEIKLINERMKYQEEIINIKKEINKLEELMKESLLQIEYNNIINKLNEVKINRDSLCKRKEDIEKTIKNKYELECEQDMMRKNEEIENNNKIIDTEIDSLKKVVKKHGEYKSICNKLIILDFEKNDINNSIKNYKKEIEVLNQKLEEYKIYEINKKNNEIITQQINELKNEYKIYETDIVKLMKEVYNIETKNEKMNDSILLYESKKKLMAETEFKFKLFKCYMEILHKNGLTLSIIKKYLEFIEIGVNNIIERFINKRVGLGIENNNIILNILLEDEKEKDKTVLMLGGRETFIFDIGFKIMLSKIGELPRSNFLFIDEGISVFDVNNLNSIGDLFNYLNSNYNHVFLMSHIEQVKDMVNKVIYVKNNGIYSRIENL
jgi:DNA repair exonuclease SbcCD ATPase subunit